MNVLKGGPGNSSIDANNIYHAGKLRLEDVNSVEAGYRAQITTNVNQRAQSQGASLTLSCAFEPALMANGSYSYNDLITKDFAVGTQSFFNTPKHKFNLGLGGQALDRTLSDHVNYHWVDSFLYESTFATGTVAKAQAVDAQMGYLIQLLDRTFSAV